MANGLDDDKVWDLMNSYRNNTISKEEIIRKVCFSDRTYEIALFDFETIVARDATCSEQDKIWRHFHAKNHKNNK